MRRIILDGREIDSRDKLHNVLKEALNLPEYYGRNLDALHDCLSEIPGLQLQLRYEQEMIKTLGSYGENLIALLKQVDEERSDFHFKLIRS